MAVTRVAPPRLAEHGRIRAGVKGAKGPESITTWRFTSTDEAAIRHIATLYGGEPSPWHDAKARPPDQWQVTTTTNRVRIMLAPNSEIETGFELWSAKGMLRRCDGTTCKLFERDEKGKIKDTEEIECLCTDDRMVCKNKLRLHVVLPELQFRGLWRLESSSWNAKREILAMEEVLRQMQEVGMLEASLVLDKRSEPGKNYVVPMLEAGASPDEIVARFGNAPRAIEAPTRRLPALNPGTDWYDQQEKAPVAFDDPLDGNANSPKIPRGQVVDVTGEDAPRMSGQQVVAMKIAHVAPSLGFVNSKDIDKLRHAVVRKVTKGRTSSSKELTEDEVRLVLNRCDEVEAGRLLWDLDEHDELTVERR